MNRLPFMEPIHVLGGGSIGLLFASSIRMAFPSYPIAILLRPHHEARLSNEASRYYMEVCVSRQNRPRVVRLPAVLIGDTGIHSFPSSKKVRNVLLTTKAPDASAAISTIQANLQTDSRILLLCNGALSVREEIQMQLPHNPITVITTTHGAYREESNDELYHVTHAGIGRTYVEDDEPLAKLLDQSGLQAESTAEMEAMLWLKLAANCTINPITAILGCRNGDLPFRPEFQTMAPSILEEICRVCPDDSLTPERLQQFVDQVIQDTARNKSSMLQDIENRRPTEVAYLNGYVVKKGLALGIPTPVNQAICNKIMGLL